MEFRRFRTQRINASVRESVRENWLSSDDFILPLFCIDGQNRSEPIESMPGVTRVSPDCLIDMLGPLVEKGLSSVLLFGVPEHKGIEQAWAPDGIVQKSIPLVKKHYPFLEVITDVCFCSYTHDGHCEIEDNDTTIGYLAKVALSHAEAGADVVAPSAMMDGQVWSIRRGLDLGGFSNTSIMSYAAKFASSYYGPFRDAATCAPKTGDRKSYQMDPANGNEALEEITEDIKQGAQSIIIKPALSYLDIIARANDRFVIPIIAYNVSGEFRMLSDAVKNGYASEDVIFETLLSVKRAGADRIISYFTPKVLESLSSGQIRTRAEVIKEKVRI